MADYTVDARGLSCPEPVVRTKKAFDGHQAFEVLVDNETSKENVIRFCDKMKAATTVAPTDDGWKISVTK
ncbi:sulfurtransferase TusA family protein [Treponema sp.]|uniref:sulfurtransferase TusA family protein n=1 Tax=Treponema sp. TaxID=166 RepID=UPI003FA1CF05